MWDRRRSKGGERIGVVRREERGGGDERSCLWSQSAASPRYSWRDTEPPSSIANRSY